jgi:hypothetical protein
MSTFDLIPEHPVLVDIDSTRDKATITWGTITLKLIRGQNADYVHVYLVRIRGDLFYWRSIGTNDNSTGALIEVVSRLKQVFLERHRYVLIRLKSLLSKAYVNHDS